MSRYQCQKCGAHATAVGMAQAIRRLKPECQAFGDVHATRPIYVGQLELEVFT